MLKFLRDPVSNVCSCTIVTPSLEGASALFEGLPDETGALELVRALDDLALLVAEVAGVRLVEELPAHLEHHLTSFLSFFHWNAKREILLLHRVFLISFLVFCKLEMNSENSYETFSTK